MAHTNQYLADLALYRNDPELARALEENALQGDRNAQYAIGLIYAEGRGVNYNPVESYAWLTVAALQGDEDALQLRYVVAEVMSPDAIAEAEDRAGIFVMHDDAYANQH
ncbi:MAG: sel1 repeat family protein [Gammaproteobacteria bacterium]|jgi:TPR repeat protein